MELLQALEVVVGVYKNLPEGEVEDHPFLYQNTNIKSETKRRVCKTLNAAVLSLTHLPKIFLLTLLFVKFFREPYLHPTKTETTRLKTEA